MLALLALKVLHPEHVHLNRGNHEDTLINDAYGFTEECKKKYDAKMFDLFIDMFCNLPLCAKVKAASLGGDPNGSIIVLHGGILSNPSQGLGDIQKIDRKKYKTVQIPTKSKRTLTFTNPSFVF